MNALSKALDEIKYTIPAELLNAGFRVDDVPGVGELVSLDDKIMNKCIRPRILVDCNLVGGVEIVVPLSNVPPTFYNDYYSVYIIDPALINNSTIVSVLNLTYMPWHSYFSQNPAAGNLESGATFNTITNIATRVSNTFSDSIAITNANVELIANNTVAIYANYRMLTSYGLRCLVENDPNLQNISPRSFKSFSKLAILGTKSFIYNKLIIKTNMGYLHGGQELGQFKTTLDSWEGAEEEYNTYLKEVWMATAFMNDTGRYHRHLRSMINPGL